MLKDKIFSLVNDKFENILKEEINNRFEVLEISIKENKNVESYDGFIAFVDGFICLSAFISSDMLISSGSTPIYLDKYINHIDNLALEYSNENIDDTQEIKDDRYQEYIADDYFYIEVNFYWYDKNEKGKGVDSLYFDYSIKNEYGKTLYLVDQKAIDEICITDSEVNENNYVEIIESAINKIKNFI